MTKARQRIRAKRRKLIAQNMHKVPMSAVHGFVNGVEQPINYWDGKQIRFVTPPPKGAEVQIVVDTKAYVGKICTPK